MQTLTPKQPCITLLFADPVLHFPPSLELAMALTAVDESPHAEDVNVEVQLQEESRLAAKVSSLEQSVRILGVGHALPAVILNQCLLASHWQGDFRSRLEKHQSQVVLQYNGKGKDTREKMVFLYEVARALYHESLLGVVNEPAMTAHPVMDTLEAERIRSYREEIPFLLWFGYPKIALTEDLSFLVTKGHAVFGLPELAWLAQKGDNLPEVLNTFFNLFYYLYNGKEHITVGDTLAVENNPVGLRVVEMPELELLSAWGIDKNNTLLLEQGIGGAVEDAGG